MSYPDVRSLLLELSAAYAGAEEGHLSAAERRVLISERLAVPLDIARAADVALIALWARREDERG